MDEFISSYLNFPSWPNNVIGTPHYKYALAQFVRRLDQNEERLFCQPSEALVDFFDYDDNLARFRAFSTKSDPELASYLEYGRDAGDASTQTSHRQPMADPRCRFIFLRSMKSSSRDALRVTRVMLTRILSHHQVMPEFLDFVLTFGRQEFQQDFYFNAFRQEMCFANSDSSMPIAELNRSGRFFQIAFNLKGVETTPNPPQWQWSIRQAALLQSFDVVTGGSLWIVTKGNKLLRDRIRQSTEPGSHPSLTNYGSSEDSLLATLQTYQLIFDCFAENWRDYINFLEEKINESSNLTLAASVDDIAPPPFEATSQTTSIQRSRSGFSGNGIPGTANNPRTATSRQTNFVSTNRRNAPRTSVNVVELDVLDKRDSSNASRLKIFSFNDLPRLHFLEDQVNEAMSILKANIENMTSLKNLYQSIMNSKDCPPNLRAKCAAGTKRFCKRVMGVIADFEMYRSWLQTLANVLKERKSLLVGILDYRTSIINLDLSKEAAASAKEMAILSEDMHKIAKKTEHQTTSMQVITWVTLCYLPPTYISTLMSTDIVRFDSSTGVSREIYSWHALRLYLLITLPLTTATLLIWLVVYRWDKDSEKRQHVFQRVFQKWRCMSVLPDVV